MRLLILTLSLLLCLETYAEPFVPVCERRIEFRSAIMRATRLPCEDITAEILAKVWRLNLSGVRTKNISATDFQGLSHLEELHLSATQIENILPGTFSNLVHLKSLFLDINNLRELKAGALDGLVSLRLLHLAHNPIVHLDPQAFRDLKNLKSVILENNRLREILPGTFSGLCHLTAIDLSRNSQLITIPDFAFAPCLSDLFVNVIGAPLTATRKAAFHGVLLVQGLPPRFDTDTTDSDWTQP